MRRSLDETLERLGVDHLPLLHLHDPDELEFSEALAPTGPVRALIRMRDEGIVDRIGISGAWAPMLVSYVETGIFDALVTHNRYTLVDRSADRLLEVAADRGVAVFNAAPYGSAPLAKWPAPATHYAYRPAHPELASAIDRMGALAGGRGHPARCRCAAVLAARRAGRLDDRGHQLPRAARPDAGVGQDAHPGRDLDRLGNSRAGGIDVAGAARPQSLGPSADRTAGEPHLMTQFISHARRPRPAPHVRAISDGFAFGGDYSPEQWPEEVWQRMWSSCAAPASRRQRWVSSPGGCWRSPTASSSGAGSTGSSTCCTRTGSA